MHELFADAVVMGGLNREPVSDLDGSRAMIEGGIEGWRSEGLGPAKSMHRAPSGCDVASGGFAGKRVHARTTRATEAVSPDTRHAGKEVA
jgi:hypothetical protein